MTARALHQAFLAATSRADRCRAYEAWFRQACREGKAPDKLTMGRPPRSAA